MADSFQTNAFTKNFITGFAFVDQIRANKKNQERLEIRLSEEREERSFQRQRTIERDEQVRENRGFDLEDRGFKQDERDLLAENRARTRTRVLREREAQKIRALGPEATREQLEEFADFEFIANILNKRRADEQLQRANETVLGPGAQTQPDQTQPDPSAAVAEDEAGQTGFAEGFGIEPPADEFSVREQLSASDLNLLANEDPDAAREIRDVQNEETVRRPRGRTGGAGPTRREIENTRKGKASAIINDQWRSFSDINDTSGDALRALDSNLLTAKWFEDRSNITDKDEQRASDIRMQPHIAATIEQQTDARIKAEPGTREHTNATRKLREAFGLGMAMGLDYSPGDAAGVKGSLPIGRNPQLTANVIEASQPGIGTPLPMSEKRQRMAETVVQRGSAGGRRLTKRQRDSAYILLISGRLSNASYATYLNTGQLPSGIKTSVVERDPKKDVVAVWTDADGNYLGEKTIVLASKSGRNVLSGDALDAIEGMETAYNTSDFPTRGTDAGFSFKSVLEQNEQSATAAGYDLSNVQDVSSLFNRWVELAIFRDAFNTEAFFNGKYDPVFSQHYGRLADALFDRSVDAAIRTGEFEVEGTTTFGLGGETIKDITPLKSTRQLTSEEMQAVQANPRFAGMSPEEIQAEFDAQQTGR